MAYVLLAAIAVGFTPDDPNPWDISAASATVMVTILGVFHLNRQNGETLGNGLVVKYFALGRTITVRMIVLVIPCGNCPFTLTENRQSVQMNP